MVSLDGTAAICPRVPSDKDLGDAGFLHRLTPDSDQVRQPLPECSAVRRALAEKHTEPGEFARLQKLFDASTSPEKVRRFSHSLGLNVGSLRELGLGYADAHAMITSEGKTKVVHAWSFPMRAFPGGGIIGLRLRSRDGFKFSYTGSRNGLFIPAGIRGGGQLLLPEGPTSTAAMRILGFNAAGRFNNIGGIDLLLDLIALLQPDRVVIVGDNDKPDKLTGRRPGIFGAARVCQALRQRQRFVREILAVLPPPSIKDSRAWLQDGANGAEVQHRIEHAALSSQEVMAHAG